MNLEEITKEDMQAYEDCRSSGVTNMFDVRTVGMITGLSKEKIMNIMKNYGKYMEEHEIEN